jgi:hypothetical protein
VNAGTSAFAFGSAGVSYARTREPREYLPVNKAKAPIEVSAIMAHPTLTMVLAVVVFAGSADAVLAQRSGGAHAPSPGIGGGGSSITPTPGIGTGSAPNVTPTPGIGTTSNPAGTLNGGESGGTPSEGTANDKTTQNARAPHGIGETTDAGVKAEYEERLPYKPCPSSVRFPNGQQACLGGP